MKASNQKTLSTDDICAILKAAKESGARVLKYGGLYIEFGSRTGVPEEETGPRIIGSRDGRPVRVAPGPSPSDLTIPAAEIAEIQRQKQTQARERDELQIREAQMEEALIEDPVLFEQLLQAGELENDGSAAFNDE
jgi:hypothetical protein